MQLKNRGKCKGYFEMFCMLTNTAFLASCLVFACSHVTDAYVFHHSSFSSTKCAFFINEHLVNFKHE